MKTLRLWLAISALVIAVVFTVIVYIVSSTQKPSGESEKHDEEVVATLPQPSPLGPNACQLIDGYRIGMTMDEFRTFYYKKFQSFPSCHPSEDLDESGEKCKNCFKCQGNMTIQNTAVDSTFSFGDGRLFAIGGNFDPRKFHNIKQGFVEQFGQPDGEGKCDQSQLRPDELERIIAYGGCEGAYWGHKDGIGIILGQAPLGNGQRFGILPTYDASACTASRPAASASPTVGKQETADTFDETSVYPGFNTYTNGKFGFHIDYPEQFTLRKNLPDGNGITLATADQEAVLTATGESKNPALTLKDYYDKNMNAVHGTLGYNKIAGNWFVISWIDSGKIGYTKTFVGNVGVNTFLFTFPEAKKSQYVPIVESMAKSFRAGNIQAN